MVPVPVERVEQGVLRAQRQWGPPEPPLDRTGMDQVREARAHRPHREAAEMGVALASRKGFFRSGRRVSDELAHSSDVAIICQQHKGME